jgi:predicted MFS family arabinose efflux permease
VDVRLLARRPVASASAVLFIAGFALYGAMLLLPLYYQEVRGVSALMAGGMLIPQGAGMLASRSVAGRLTDKIGARPVAEAVIAHPGRLAAAFDVAFWWSAGFSVAAVLLSMWLPGRPRDRERPEAAAAIPVPAASGSGKIGL